MKELWKVSFSHVMLDSGSYDPGVQEAALGGRFKFGIYQQILTSMPWDKQGAPPNLNMFHIFRDKEDK